jgi:hypothetical protein
MIHLAVRIALAILVLCGCAAGLPGSAREHLVVYVTQRGAYLDAVLERSDATLRFFFPADETCREALRKETWVEYVNLGTLGEVRAADLTCTPVGIASLEAWRSRRGRRLEGPLPRSPVSFRVVYQDEEYVLARGRFPLANRIGWSGGEDTLALIPRTAACAPVIARGTGSMEFRVAGRDPFILVSAAGRCPIEGFVRPLGRD